MIDPEKTVYVVDDDASVLKALGRLLKSAGYKVQSFASAEDFLGQIHCHPVECLILDMRLAGMSGLELQAHLRSCNYAIPIVFVTAHDDPHTRSQAMRNGARTFLRKPFDEKLLLDAVDGIFQELTGRPESNDEGLS